jgi:predicted membrane protein (TIGR00267 family)
MLTPPQSSSDRTWLRGSLLRDIILGWQDGLVNVLGLVLGVATATDSTRIVLISGLAALFAESASMAAVAYTSSKAARDYYHRELRREQREVEQIPETEVQEIRDIYHRKGFRDEELERIVRKITSDKKLWVETMMAEELRLFPEEYQNPSRSAGVVGLSAVIGSLIPLVPFFFLAPRLAVIPSVTVSTLVLFGTGSLKARLTVGDWRKSGIEMALVGSAAAVFGYVIGVLLGSSVP